MYTKNVVNEFIFLPVTHTTYFDIQFSRYRFLNSGQGAENFLDRLDIPMNDQVFQVQDA
jgi:hypothetical protein